MIEYRIQQEVNAKELYTKKQRELSKLRAIVTEIRESEARVKDRVEEAHLRKQERALEIKRERSQIKKQLNKYEKMYIRRAQEKRFEQQVMQEASKIKQEQNIVNRLSKFKGQKDDALHKEGKIITKKEKEAKKLELLEAEVLKRLRDTHLRQQEAIEEIQNIFKQHERNRQQKKHDLNMSLS